jgi:competence protein ComEA
VDDLLVRPDPPRPIGQRVREWLEWFGAGRLVAIAVSVVLVGAGGYWLVAPPPQPVEASLPVAGELGAAPSTVPPPSVAASTSTIETVEAIDVVVHVAGAVMSPGIHRLAPGARVADAVVAAGGLAADAHADAINLAAPVHDGDRVYVPALAEGLTVAVGVTPAEGSGAGADSGTQPAGPVSINRASVDELDALPGVGPATAAAIVAHREQAGPFSSVDGLADVRGIGPSKLEAIRPLVTL